MTEIERFHSANGAYVYRLPVEVFSGYMAYAHLVEHQGTWTLIDVGSGFGSSHADLLRGIQAVSKRLGRTLSLADVSRIIITHGHIDHFGGLTAVKKEVPAAEVAIHELDKRVLINYDERVLVTSLRMADFLVRAGVPEERRQHLMQMYLLGKQNFEATPVDVTLRDGDILDGVFEIIHVPGHSPGLIMVRIGDILITADHVLPHTSVALAPESIMPYTGVGHYLESLDRASCVSGVVVALGGHEEPMVDYAVAVARTRDQSVEKIERLLTLCREPRAIYEMAVLTYPELSGYGELLKINQTGARLEYLHQRGRVMVDNLDALDDKAVSALQYVAVN